MSLEFRVVQKLPTHYFLVFLVFLVSEWFINSSLSKNNRQNIFSDMLNGMYMPINARSFNPIEKISVAGKYPGFVPQACLNNRR